MSKSLGRSNDRPRAVRIEIRAAELATTSEDPGTYAEYDGWWTHPEDQDDVRLNTTEWLSGWLAREIATHDERGKRDDYTDSQ